MALVAGSGVVLIDPSLQGDSISRVRRIDAVGDPPDHPCGGGPLAGTGDVGSHRGERIMGDGQVPLQEFGGELRGGLVHQIGDRITLGDDGGG